LTNRQYKQSVIPDVKIEKSGNLDIRQCQFEIFFKDIASAMPLQERVSTNYAKS
jgi:two-component system phosphate regulon sensor histidine kinase PhoR